MSLERSNRTGRREPVAGTFADAFGERATDRPVVGLSVDAAADANAVAGAILRARVDGFPVVVAHVAAPDHEAVAFADHLGVPVVEVDALPGERPRAVVASLARDAGFPAVIWSSDPADRIDFAGTLDALDGHGSYVVEPAIEPAVDGEPDVLVGIPAYDEAETIADVVDDAAAHADEVLVVDDGSSDRTAEVAADAGATVIEHDENRGYGAALKTVFEAAERSNADHLVVLDGDGQHDPADVPALVREQRDSGAELVIGSRFDDDGETNAALYRRVGLFVVNTLTNLSLGVVRPRSWISDTQSGFRAYDDRAIADLAEGDGIGDRMSASTDILYHAHSNDYEIREVGTAVDYDVDDANSHHPVSHGLTLVNNILRTVERERPISVIGVPGFASTSLGIGLGYLTVSNYVTTGTFPMGYAIASTMFGLAGVFACFTAIILHSLNTRARA